MPSWKKVIISGSNAILNTVSASSFTGSFTGSLFGTASYANSSLSSSYSITSSVATSASYAATASYVVNALTASYVVTAQTASYVLNAVSSSFASTASFLNNTTNAFIQNGNSFGATALLGTNDNQSLALETSGSTRMFISSSGNVGIGTTTPDFKLVVTDTNNYKGILVNGSNSPVIAFDKSTGQTAEWKVGISGNDGNSFSISSGTANTDRLFITSSGNVGIGTTTPTLGTLQVNGNVYATSFTGSLLGTASYATNALSSSYAATASIATSSSYALSASFAPAGNPFPFTGSAVITGSLTVTGSVIVTQNITGSRLFLSSSNGTVSGSTLIVYGSGSAQPVFTVQGSQGELFSITDSLTGSLFSVNDISGLPILEVFSDSTTLIGNYQAPALYTTNKVTSISGSNVIYSLPTASYDGVFVDYTIRSGSNARAGQVMGIWSGSLANYTDNSTTDFGTTVGFIFAVIVSGSNMVVTGSSTTAGWTVKTIIRSI
jgi:hypothetical protein